MKIFFSIFIINFLNYINLNNIEKTNQINKTKILACLTLVKLKLENDKNFFKYISKELEKKFKDDLDDEESGYKYIKNYFIYKCYKIITEKQMFNLISDVQKNKNFVDLNNYNNIFEIKQFSFYNISTNEIENINDILTDLIKEKNQNKKEKLNINKNEKLNHKILLKNIKKIQEKKVKNFEKKNHTKKIRKINNNPEYNNTIWENVIINKELKEKNKIKFYEIIGLNSYLGIIISSLFLLNIFNLKKTIKKTFIHNQKNIKIMKNIFEEIIEKKTI